MQQTGEKLVRDSYKEGDVIVLHSEAFCKLLEKCGGDFKETILEDVGFVVTDSLTETKWEEIVESKLSNSPRP